MAIRQAGTKQWTEARAQAAIAEWAASGLSGRDYARANGIDHQRLFWWRRRFEASKKSGLDPIFGATRNRIDRRDCEQGREKGAASARGIVQA